MMLGFPLRRLAMRALWLHGAGVLALAACAGAQDAATPAPQPASAQQQPPQKKKFADDYVIHSSVELGGHIADRSGSGAVYATMVNLQSGPRILGESLDMRAVPGAHPLFFDRLSTQSFGYGGDPNNVTFLNAGKGRIYDFRGSFRRSRSYFDYNLLANPLIPPTSDPYVPVLDSPHLFNTVRRMTDLGLTLAPLSHVSARFGWNRNISEGPSYSTVHYGAEALLLQNWRNGTDNWTGGVDWKPNPRTSASYDQFVTWYKGDTNWSLTGLNYALSNGTPVSGGIDFSSVWSAPCAKPLASDGSFSPTCNAFLAYSRSAPTRTVTPTEQLRFQSASVPHFTLNGRFLYSGSTSKLNNFNEYFDGLESRTSLRAFTITGSAEARRVNTNGDFGVTWQIMPKVAASDVFDFAYYRIPGTNTFTEADYAGSSMLNPVSSTPSSVTTTPDAQFLNQKTRTNTFLVAWDAAARARFSIGYRYRSRLITGTGGESIPIHESWGLFGAALQPAPQWRINFIVDAMYADNAFTRISPRQLQHYRVRSTYNPRQWLALSGTANIFESRDNVQTVNHLEHNRDFSFAAAVTPNERWSMDLSYAYDSVYSTTLECYTASPAVATAGIAPPVCVAAGTPLASNGYYNVPTQTGSIGFVLTPVKRFHLNAGYRMTAVNGSTDFVNARQVNGSLQSQYQSPYASVAFDLEPKWTWKADYNYYGYGEGSPVGPTNPRNFHGNLCTMSVKYAF